MKIEEGEQHGFLKSSAPPKEVSQRLGRIPWPIITTVCIDHCRKPNSIHDRKKKKIPKISSSFSIPYIRCYDVTSAEWLVEESEAKDPISLNTSFYPFFNHLLLSFL
jgi:hypothetical protein